MSFLILGCGPIGGIFAAFASPHAERIAVIDANEAHLQKIRQEGLKVILPDGTRNVSFASSHRDIGEIREFFYDYLVVALKTPVMEEVIPSVAHMVPEKTVVVSLQNGIGTEDFLADHFGVGRVVRIVVNYAGALIEPGVVKQTFFNPPNYIGAHDARAKGMAKELASFLTMAALATEFTDELERYEWEKSALNVAMSSISAITGLNMQEVMASPNPRGLLVAVLKEITAVARVRGIPLGDAYIQSGLKYFDNAGPHIPSMRLDIEGKRKTEIGFLNHKILEAAYAAGVPAPRLECLTSLIESIAA